MTWRLVRVAEQSRMLRAKFTLGSTPVSTTPLVKGSEDSLGVSVLFQTPLLAAFMRLDIHVYCLGINDIP